MPYPGIEKRVERLENRQDITDASVSGLIATTAVHTEQTTALKEDLHSVIDAIDRANARVTAILRALWGLFLVLLPVAASLVIIAIQN